MTIQDEVRELQHVHNAEVDRTTKAIERIERLEEQLALLSGILSQLVRQTKTS